MPAAASGCCSSACGDCVVELDQLVGQQFVEDGLAQERVPELVCAFFANKHAGVGGRTRRRPGPVGR